MTKRKKVSARSYRAGEGATKQLNIKVRVHRSAGPGFRACAGPNNKVPGKAASRKGYAFPFECASGAAPRRAIASALSKLASNFRKRSSAFAGK